MHVNELYSYFINSSQIVLVVIYFEHELFADGSLCCSYFKCNLITGQSNRLMQLLDLSSDFKKPWWPNGLTQYDQYDLSRGVRGFELRLAPRESFQTHARNYVWNSPRILRWNKTLWGNVHLTKLLNIISP